MTLQHTPENRQKKIDLNLLPPEYLPGKRSQLTLVLVLVAILLACAAAVLIIEKSKVDNDIAPMGQEISQLDTTAQTINSNYQQANSIQNMINDNVSRLAALGSNYNTIIRNRILWSQIISEIKSFTPTSKVTLIGIAISGACMAPNGVCPQGSSPVITFGGTAKKQQYVLDYATSIEGSPFFVNVVPSFTDPGSGSVVQFQIRAPLDMTSIGNTSNP